MEVQVREKCGECKGRGRVPTRILLSDSVNIVPVAVVHEENPCDGCQGEGHTVRWVPIEELPLAVEVKRLRLGLSSLDSHLLGMGERSLSETLTDEERIAQEIIRTVREVARHEVARFVRLHADELDRRGVGPNQAMPFRDEWVALHTALRRFNEGEVIL